MKKKISMALVLFFVILLAGGYWVLFSKNGLYYAYRLLHDDFRELHIPVKPYGEFSFSYILSEKNILDFGDFTLDLRETPSTFTPDDTLSDNIISLIKINSDKKLLVAPEPAFDPTNIELGGPARIVEKEIKDGSSVLSTVFESSEKTFSSYAIPTQLAIRTLKIAYLRDAVSILKFTTNTTRGYRIVFSDTNRPFTVLIETKRTPYLLAFTGFKESEIETILQSVSLKNKPN